MRIAHISDTHLGHTGQGIQPQVQNPFHPGSWITQRAADILIAFERSIDLILNQVRPDIVIHSGDLFDSAAPQMSIVDFAMRQVRRITQSGLPLVVIEGNQSSPRERSMGHVLQLLDHLPGVQVVCETNELIRFDDLSVAIHAFPHTALVNDAVPTASTLITDYANILVAHGVADDAPFYRTHRPAPPIFLASCGEWFDYVALGHCHRFCQPNQRRRAFYAGSTSMITWGDFSAGQSFSLNEVELTGKDPIVRRVPIEGRPMHAYGLDDATGLSAGEILEFICRQVEVSPPDSAYCLTQIMAIDPVARKDLDAREVRELFESAAGLKLILENRNLPLAQTLRAQSEGGLPSERFAGLVAISDGDDAFRDDVLTLGLALLEQAADEVAAEADE
jgi:hypothetical protein